MQKPLRHTRPDTTLENYVKDIPDSVYAMVDALYEGIPGTEKEPVPTLVKAVGGVQ